MGNKHNTIRVIILAAVCITVIVLISVLFISKMNETVENNTMNTIEELAEHDRIAIQNFVNMKWKELQNIQHRIGSFGGDSILDIQERMNLETASSDFQNLFLIAEDGSVYTDRYMVYPKEYLDIMPYFSEGSDRLVRIHDYNTTVEMQKETLLYAIRLDNYAAGDTRFIALAGITDIKQIQDNIKISAFNKDGRSRGYSSVVNMNGDFVVNIEKTVSLNQNTNMYDMLDKGSVDDIWNRDTIREKMQKHEIFSFYYNDENNVEKFMYFIPVENTNWYFLTMVEKEVFSEQSHSFSFTSTAMLVIAVLIVTALLMFVMFSRNRIMEVKAEAKARSDFLSNMSHEIRTPLNGVIGLLYLMKMHLYDGDNEKMAEWIDKAHSTANYLLSLVCDILDMSKIQAGKLDIENKPFMVEAMLDAVCSMQQNNIKERGITFIVFKKFTQPCIIGDETRIKQILMNILGNAAKFTSKGGMIRLTARQEEKDDKHVSTIISCEDTGIGMSRKFLETIWDSFSQERNAKTSSIKGTGLGMAISKRFVDAMGGEIFVESEPGVGSTFTLVLHSEISEIIPDSVHSGEEEFEDDTDNNENSKTLRMLVAEDNELNSEILMAILTDKGFEVVLAENGQIAVDRFRESKPYEFDLILMDMQMPVMDGCQATKKIRSMDRADALTIPIFACTANTFETDRSNALESGMSDFLTKPIDIDMLLSKFSVIKQNKNKG